MSRILVFAATASLISAAAHMALAQEAHESPDNKPGTSIMKQIEVRAGSLYSPYDLASSGLNAEDLVPVSSFTSSEKREADRPSRDDY